MVITYSNGDIFLAKVQPAVTSEISWWQLILDDRVVVRFSDQRQKIIGYNEQPQSGELSLDQWQLDASTESLRCYRIKSEKSVELEKAK